MSILKLKKTDSLLDLLPLQLFRKLPDSISFDILN